MSTACYFSSGVVFREDVAKREEGLVAAAQAGSSDAFQEIEKLYSPRLYKRILSITRNHEDAEDALQDTFLRAFVAIESFEGRSLFSTWITRIAINSALMSLRRRRTHFAVSLQEQTESGEEVYSLDICDTAPNPEEICDLKQRTDRIFSAIERLDPKLRSAIGICISKECSMKEIACTLNVSLPTVKARLYRARKRLAQLSVPENRKRNRPLRHCKLLAFGLQNREEPCLNH